MLDKILSKVKNKTIKRFLNIYSWNHSVFILSIVIGVIITCAIGVYANKTQNDLANSVLRLHIIPNSNSQFDQSLKLKVRDQIINEMSKKFELSNSIELTKEIANNNLDEVKYIAQKVISQNGYNYAVNVSLGESYFPTKTYGNVAFPPGYYDALIVRIGEAKGANWWCVMFPPLCFVDATNGSMPRESQEKLKRSVTEEEYKLLTSYSNGDVEFKAKFKAVEVWQSSKHKAQVAIGNLF